MEAASVEGNRACVLVAIDFSKGALGALHEGRWLAHRAGLDLRVLHVAESGSAWPPDSPAWDWLTTAPIEPGMVAVRQGQPWIEIVRHAHEISAAVIVLGSHGASGIQALSLGSTACRVALRAPCPVLFVARAADELEPTSTSTHPGG
jgi:nucleotide-binding universal stress UspA family protein